MMMESPFFTRQIGKLYQKDKLPFKGFYCGCGIILPKKELFQAHCLEEHDGEYISRSSHYFSKCFN